MNLASALDLKPYLFTISYNLLGDVAAAEDIVQTIYEKWLTISKEEIKNPKAYLSKMVVHESIKGLEKQKREREAYKGFWLPEPLVLETKDEEARDVLDYALLFLLDRLNPYERAVFVLREAFDRSYEDISELLNISLANCRQLLHRAKEKVKSLPKRQMATKEKEKQILEAFMTAVHLNDLQTLETVLKQDVAFYSDGGGKMAAALKPLFGFNKVVKFLLGVMELQKNVVFTAKEVQINGGLGIVLWGDGDINSMMWLELDDDKISTIFSLRNPDKINF